jgi:hypothetical protein
VRARRASASIKSSPVSNGATTVGWCEKRSNGFIGFGRSAWCPHCGAEANIVYEDVWLCPACHGVHVRSADGTLWVPLEDPGFWTPIITEIARLGFDLEPWQERIIERYFEPLDDSA